MSFETFMAIIGAGCTVFMVVVALCVVQALVG